MRSPAALAPSVRFSNPKISVYVPHADAPVVCDDAHEAGTDIAYFVVGVEKGDVLLDGACCVGVSKLDMVSLQRTQAKRFGTEEFL